MIWYYEQNLSHNLFNYVKIVERTRAIVKKIVLFDNNENIIACDIPFTIML